MISTNFQKISKKRTSFVLLFLYILNTMTTLAQNKTTPNMEELKLKSKQELVQIAFDIIKEKRPSLVLDSNDFESSAWGNSKELFVMFRRYIRFIPLGAQPNQYYDVTVNLVKKQILPFESGNAFTFYIPTEEDKKKLAFIYKEGFPTQDESEITITENEEYYWINRKNKTSSYKYFLDKKSGFISRQIQGDYSIIQSKPVLESIYEREQMIPFFDYNHASIITQKSIIKMALIVIKKKHPLLEINLDDYEISILGDSKNTLVEFRRIIRYFPLGTNPEKKFSYDLKINLNTNEISPFDDAIESEFYIETEEDKKALAFVKKNFGNFSSNSENSISETEQSYLIYSGNDYGFRRYDLNKKTGEYTVVEELSMHPIPIPMPEPTQTTDPDSLLEIK